MSQADRKRPDKDGTHRAQFDRNKRKIFKTQTICGICGKPVDFSLKYPHPMSATVDHIIPIAKGGHPSDISNLQLAHFQCNVREKAPILFIKGKTHFVIDFTQRVYSGGIDSVSGK